MFLYTQLVFYACTITNISKLTYMSTEKKNNLPKRQKSKIENHIFLKYFLNNAFYNNVDFTEKVGIYVKV